MVEALAASSAHAASTAIYYSLQCRIDYLLETHLPALTRPLACAVDEALRRAYHLAFEVDLLDPVGQVPGQDDPTFLRDLARLKVSARGCGTRCTDRRAVFLTSLNNALPQLMGTDRTPALWPSLAPILGADSFKDENTATRWTTFFESSSAWAKAFSEEITRVKALRTTALTAAGYDTASPPESELFDKPRAAFGAGHKKFSETYSKRSARLRPKPNSAGPATFSATTSASSLSSRATPTSAPTRSSQARPASSPHSPAASSSLRFRMSSARRSACSATLPISISILMPLGRPNGSTPMATISKNWRNRRVTAFG